MVICICDDEKYFCDDLRKKIITYSFKTNTDFEFIVYNSTKELLSCVETYDVLFLDIRFDGKDIGLHTARQLRNKNVTSYIVILTSQPGYEKDGYYINAFRYISKPINDEELSEVIDDIYLDMHTKNCKANRITVPIGKNIEVVNLKDLIWVQSNPMDRKRHLLCSKSKIITQETLKNIYSKLPSNQFVYIHQSYVINLDYVKNVMKNSIITVNNAVLPLGRNYKSSFLTALQQYTLR